MAPMLSTPGLAAALVVSLAIYKYFIHPVFLSPLSKIPNAHPSSSISPLWILWIRYKSRANKTVHQAHLKHGPIVRLAPNEISINCVDGGIRTVYAGGFEKTAWYPNQFMNYGVSNMFSMVHSKPHSDRKRMVSNVYSKTYLQSSSAMSAVTSTVLYDRLLPYLAKPRGMIEVYALFTAATMDIVSAYKFGLSTSTNWLVDEKARDRFMDLYHSRKQYTFWPSEVPYVTKLLRRIGLSPVPAWVDSANQELEAWCLAMCDGAEAASPPSNGAGAGGKADHDRRSRYEPVVYQQLKSALLKSSSEFTSSPHLLRITIASELLDNAAAGFETSSVTLTYLTHRLSQRPSLQAQLRRELLTLDPPLTRSSSPVLPSAKDLDALPLLHACLMETLRLHAAIPGAQPRVTPYPSCSLGAGDKLYEGIPPGIRVSAQAWSLHRNQDVFPEPEQWRPERWLDKTEEGKLKIGGTLEMMRWFWAFGSGGRMCVGSNLAIYVMKYIAAAIYTNFNTSIIDDEGIEQADFYTAHPESGRLMLKFEKISADE